MYIRGRSSLSIHLGPRPIPFLFLFQLFLSLCSSFSAVARHCKSSTEKSPFKIRCVRLVAKRYTGYLSASYRCSFRLACSSSFSRPTSHWGSQAQPSSDTSHPAQIVSSLWCVCGGSAVLEPGCAVRIKSAPSFFKLLEV